MEEKIYKLLIEKSIRIINNATQYALFSNALTVAKERYLNLDQNIVLSTMGGIPRELLSKFEIDIRLTKEELVEVYGKDLVELNFKNFFINTIAEIDYIFEDIFRIILENDNYEDGKIEKEIRNLWANNNFYNYLIDKDYFGLKNNLEFKKLFFHYLQIRIVRHALIHTDGILNERQVKHIEQLNNEVGDQNFVFLRTRLFSENNIIIDFENGCNLRRYCIDFVSLLIGHLKQ